MSMRQLYTLKLMLIQTPAGVDSLKLLFSIVSMTGWFPFPPSRQTFVVKYLLNLALKAFKLALKSEELCWGQTHTTALPDRIMQSLSNCLFLQIAKTSITHSEKICILFSVNHNQITQE